MRYGILLLCLFILSVQHCYSQCNGSAGQCVGNQSSTSSPAPTGGQYAGGTVVTFCYTMQNYEQCSTNWIHTFDINLGPGWDASTLMPISSPSTCDGMGQWGFYNTVTSSITGATFGPCFSYD